MVGMHPVPGRYDQNFIFDNPIFCKFNEQKTIVLCLKLEN